MGNKKIAIAVITLNEEKNIGRFLESVKWADEIIVVDAGSKDKTIKIAKQYTNKIKVVDKIPHGEARQIAHDMAESEWLLREDADREITEDLKNEILSVVENKEYDGYAIKQSEPIIGKWYDFPKNKNPHPQLVRKDKAHLIKTYVHERYEVNGKIPVLKNSEKHYVQKNTEISEISDMLNRIDRNTNNLLKDRKNSKPTFKKIDIIYKPLREFIYELFLQRWIRHGMRGIIHAIEAAYEKYIGEVKTYEYLEKNGGQWK